MEKVGIIMIKVKYNSIVVRVKQTRQQYLAKEVAPQTPNVPKGIGIMKAKIWMQIWRGKTGTEHTVKGAWNLGEHGGDPQGGLQMGSKIIGILAHHSMEGKEAQVIKRFLD